MLVFHLSYMHSLSTSREQLEVQRKAAAAAAAFGKCDLSAGAPLASADTDLHGWRWAEILVFSTPEKLTLYPSPLQLNLVCVQAAQTCGLQACAGHLPGDL